MTARSKDANGKGLIWDGKKWVKDATLIMDDEIIFSDGATLRDRFAIAWMTGMHEKMVDIRKIKEDPKQAESDRRFVAKEAYAFADAMLAERQVGAIIDPDKEKEADEILHSNGLK